MKDGLKEYDNLGNVYNVFGIIAFYAFMVFLILLILSIFGVLNDDENIILIIEKIFTKR
jgi:hypothetical protein